MSFIHMSAPSVTIVEDIIFLEKKKGKIDVSSCNPMQNKLSLIFNLEINLLPLLWRLKTLFTGHDFFFLFAIVAAQFRFGISRNFRLLRAGNTRAIVPVGTVCVPTAATKSGLISGLAHITLACLVSKVSKLHFSDNEKIGCRIGCCPLDVAVS